MKLTHDNLKLYLLVQAAVCENEAKHKVGIGTKVIDEFLDMPENILEMIKETYEPGSSEYSVAIDFADYEYEMMAAELSVVPIAHDIDSILPLWLIEYIKWKPKKTPQDQEIMQKIIEWETRTKK